MDHNYSGEISHIRDTFLRSESEFLKEVAYKPGFVQLYNYYAAMSLEEIIARMTNLINKMENGEVKQEDEDKVELAVMCCSLAIEDAVKRRIKELTRHEEKEEGMSRGGMGRNN